MILFSTDEMFVAMCSSGKSNCSDKRHVNAGSSMLSLCSVMQGEVKEGEIYVLYASLFYVMFHRILI